MKPDRQTDQVEFLLLRLQGDVEAIIVLTRFLEFLLQLGHLDFLAGALLLEAVEMLLETVDFTLESSHLIACRLDFDVALGLLLDNGLKPRTEVAIVEGDFLVESRPFVE